MYKYTLQIYIDYEFTLTLVMFNTISFAIFI